MSDRELLEKAAKAAGMRALVDGVKWPSEKVGWFFNDPVGNNPALYDRSSPLLTKWAPLTDDGDALRLAVKLHIRFEPDEVEFRVSANECFEDWGSDPQAATRRAIVRAAAALAGDREQS